MKQLVDHRFRQAHHVIKNVVDMMYTVVHPTTAVSYPRNEKSREEFSSGLDTHPPVAQGAK